MLKKHTLDLLKKYDLTAKKKLGQNFLISEKSLNKIVEAASLEKKDEVLEIGPGLGTLTKILLQRCKKVSAIELDADMITILKEELSTYKNLELIHSDALKYEPETKKYKLVANIPYYVTSPLISRFLFKVKNIPQLMVLLIQKEVAQKICAQEGNLSVLALRVQIFGKPKIVATVKSGSFHPAPKVDSAILKIEPYQKPLIKKENIETAFKLIEAGFSQKRKKLKTSLKKLINGKFENSDVFWQTSKVDSNERPENLKIEDWNNLAEVFRKAK